MRINAFLVTCLAILITTSCGDKSVTPIQPPDYEAQIVGEWLWVESCGGIDGNCYDSSGFGDEFIGFGKEGSFLFWGTLIDPMDGIKYKIEQKTSYFYGPDTIVTAIVFKHENATFTDWIINFSTTIHLQLCETVLTVMRVFTQELNRLNSDRWAEYIQPLRMLRVTSKKDGLP